MERDGWLTCQIASFNSLRPRLNRRHVADDLFKCNFLNENVWIPIKISLKFVPKGPSNNIPALVQIMAWRRPGDKPLSEPMMVRLPTHISVTRPQWVNTWGLRRNGRHLQKTFWWHFLNWKYFGRKRDIRLIVFLTVQLTQFWRTVGMKIYVHVSSNKCPPPAATHCRGNDEKIKICVYASSNELNAIWDKYVGCFAKNNFSLTEPCLRWSTEDSDPSN